MNRTRLKGERGNRKRERGKKGTERNRRKERTEGIKQSVKEGTERDTQIGKK